MGGRKVEVIKVALLGITYPTITLDYTGGNLIREQKNRATVARYEKIASLFSAVLIHSHLIFSYLKDR